MSSLGPLDTYALFLSLRGLQPAVISLRSMLDKQPAVMSLHEMLDK